MTDTTPKQTYLTQDTFDRLKTELDDLKGRGRIDVAKEIDEARQEGDLSENGGYQAAKEKQGLMESRIIHLETLLQNAIIGETPADDGVVEPGMIVTVEMFGDTEKFLLGSREIAADTHLDVWSESSPLGQAVNGHKRGDTVSYETPTGKTVEVKIVDATPFTG